MTPVTDVSDVTDGRRRAGAKTRSNLLAAATTLLAQHGRAGVTLRAVGEAAGANVAAVKYHFGSRDALILEAIDSATRPVVNEQMAGLRLLEDRDDTPDPAKWVEAWSRPLIRVALSPSEEERHLGRILGLTFAAPEGELDDRIRRAATEPSAHLIAGLAQALPGVTRAELRLRLAVMASALAGLASGAFQELLSRSGPANLLEERMLDRMIAIALA